VDEEGGGTWLVPRRKAVSIGSAIASAAFSPIPSQLHNTSQKCSNDDPALIKKSKISGIDSVTKKDGQGCPVSPAKTSKEE
jgi:hypothetical protein